jgi:hypothetical protein
MEAQRTVQTEIKRLKENNTIVFNGVVYQIDDRFAGPNDVVVVVHVAGVFKSIRSATGSPIPSTIEGAV